MTLETETKSIPNPFDRCSSHNLQAPITGAQDFAVICLLFCSCLTPSQTLSNDWNCLELTSEKVLWLSLLANIKWMLQMSSESWCTVQGLKYIPCPHQPMVQSSIQCGPTSINGHSSGDPWPSQSWSWGSLTPPSGPHNPWHHRDAQAVCILTLSHWSTGPLAQKTQWF